MFTIPESGAQKPENRFEFADATGKKHSVPLLGFICGEAHALIERGLEYDGTVAAFDNDEAREVYKALSRDQLREFDTAWVAASRVSPGESQSSAAS